MKIAYVFDQFPATSETFLAREIAALRRNGCQIEVFALRAGEGALPLLRHGFLAMERAARVLARNEAARERSFERLGARFGQELRARRFDWIHAAFASHPAAIARAAGKSGGLPFSFAAHARDVWVEGGNLAEKLRDARFAACCTRAGAARLKEIAPQHAGKVFYLPHGIDLSLYQFSVFSPPRARLEIFSVGRLVEKKGFATLIRALAILRKEARGAFSLRAQIVGGGPQQAALKRLAARLELANCIFFRGEKTPIETRRAMHAASTRGAIFALPSQEARDGDRDGLPNVLLEAAACGMPLVATRGGAIEDAFGESSAVFCAWKNAEALARAIFFARFEEEQSRARCEIARRIVAQNFDVEKNVLPLCAMFSAAI